MKPLTEIVLKKEKSADGYSDLVAKLAADGKLVLEGIDAGDDVEKWHGDWDYEYWLTVPKEFGGAMLLHLLKERFSSVQDLRKWLDERKIPFEFQSI
jgi:hypothetical protein